MERFSFEVGDRFALQNIRFADEIVPLLRARGVVSMDAGPFSARLLARAAFPAGMKEPEEVQAAAGAAAAHCDSRGVDIATTLAGGANPANIRQWAQWAEEPIDLHLLSEVRAIFSPAKGRGHAEGLPENNSADSYHPMKALCLEAPLSWKRIEIAEPPDPGPGEALVRVHRVGICGTDIGGFLGKMPFFSYPRIPGHELGVEVLAVGAGVTHVQEGDRCSVEPYLNCGHCHSCLRGHTNCCESNRTLGVMCDGGLTDRILLPAAKLHPSALLDYSQLALVETLAIGCHAVDRGRPTRQEAVLVVGAGPIGLSAVEFARLSGAQTVVMDMNERRLAFVRERMGIRDTILATGDGRERERLAELTDGRLADVVVDATGSHRSMANSLNLCAFKGRLVYVGITQSEIPIPHAPALHRRELDILASRNALPEDFSRILRHIEAGRIDTGNWITHQVGFEDVIGAFPGWTRPESGVVKAVVEVQG